MPAEQRTALVTGGSGGLGEAIARALHDAGHTVLIVHSPGNASIGAWLKTQTPAKVTTSSPPTARMWPTMPPARVGRPHSNRRSPHRHSGQQRGHHARCYVPQAELRRLGCGPARQSRLRFQRHPAIHRRHARTRLGQDRQHLLHQRLQGQFGQTNYSAKPACMASQKPLRREVARKGVTVNTVSPGYLDTKMVTSMSEEVVKASDCRYSRGSSGTA